ncbi:MFS transporter [Sodalis ligni]|jgi:MFS family permease|uniref:Sugar phosphate permease n=1 Tax=Sodalis ligni TaxID=2697027 RepID=A0A4R1N961_9GAMM|nr:MFS transporter [Sodalis ligni]TCL03159.1 sugar phosphate permease [Sodalis ligni]
MTRSVLINQDDDRLLERAINRAKWRLLPFLILMFLLAYLDRVNIGFAKQAYQISTGLSDTAFAFGAGIFFITYALFEIPSNLMMHRLGPRVWLSRIMITWGIISAAMCFAHSTTSFYIIRMLLGVAEAGFFPGVIYFITQWFPAKSRGHIMSIFYFGSPLALIVGGPISGYLLDLHGLWGLEGWQLMFLIEGFAASVMGIWAFFYLRNTPSEAKWLPEDEKSVLMRLLAKEEREKARYGAEDFIQALKNPTLILFAAIYFLIQITGLGVAFYLPTQVGALLGMHVGLTVGLVSAIPWICALVAGAFWPKLAVKVDACKLFGIISLTAIALGLILSAGGSPLVAIIALCFVTMGIMTAQPIFWTWPTGMFGGAAAAGSFALINSCGALGGFVAPNIRNGAEKLFDSTSAGLYALAGAAIVAIILFIFLPTRKQLAAHAKGNKENINYAD